ncbi:hypothetical protein ABPG74_000828 [Tetrahymena malaccensis]
MKYYKDDILRRWSAKFKDSSLEQSFHRECSSGRFKITYLMCIQIMVFSSLQIIFFSEKTVSTYSQIIAPFIIIILIKFVPMKYSQYLIVLGQIYSTYSICARNTKEQNKSFEIYYMNGLVQVVIWIVEIQNFTVEVTSMIINLAIITYFQQISYIYSVNYSFCIFILCAYKYSHNISDRKLYLALKNFQEWEKIFEKIIPNLFILQQFDYRTHKMSLLDCNKRAQQFGIQKGQEKYIEFLSSLQIEEFDLSSKQNSYEKKQQQIKTLKDYLLEKHANIYSQFVQSKLNKQKKFKSMKTSSLHISHQDQYQSQMLNQVQEKEKIDSLKVSFLNQDKSQKTIFKVNVHKVFMNEPFLVICLEDISFFQKMKTLEDDFYQKKDLVYEMVNCISNKLSSIKCSNKNLVDCIKKQIAQTQIILQAFIQKLRPTKVQNFLFQEVIQKVQFIYQDFDFKIQGNITNLQINSDKGFIFITLISFISALGAENIEFFKIYLKKEDFCDKIVLIIQSTYTNFNFNDHSSITLFGIQKPSKMNTMCWEYIQNIMKLICLQDKPIIQIIDSQKVQFQIEYIADITILKQNYKFSLSEQNDHKLSRQKTGSNISNLKNQLQLTNSIYQSPQYKYMISLNECTKNYDILSPIQKFDFTNSDIISLK